MNAPKCSVCNWTNTGLWNLGVPGKPEWVCQGCSQRTLKNVPTLLNACKIAFASLEALKQSGDAQDWESFTPLHMAHKALKVAITKAEAP